MTPTKIKGEAPVVFRSSESLFAPSLARALSTIGRIRARDEN